MERQGPPGRQGVGTGTVIVVSALVSTIVSAVVVGLAGAIALALWDAPPGGGGGESYELDDEAPVAPDAENAEAVDPSRVIEATFAAGDDAPRLYSFRLPEDAVCVRVDLLAEDADVDLRAAFGTRAADDEDWRETSEGAEGDESVSIVRDDEPDFSRKPLIVRVDRYDGGQDEIEFTLELTVVRQASSGRLAPGGSARATISPETGHRAAFDVVLPAGVDAVRVDLVNVRQNLDLAADAAPILDLAHAATSAETPVGRESLVLRRGEMRLAPGEQALSLVVFDPARLDRTIPFGVRVSAGESPPPGVRSLPEIPLGAWPAERAAAAVVEIFAGDDSEGTGVVVGRARRILTAAHVVEDVPMNADEIIIACTTDVTREPEELLRGRVIRRDDERDIAIVEVTSTLYGDPVPDDWKLPRVRVRWDQPTRLGETVHACGFPVLHRGAERSEVTWTSGVLSGYESPFEHQLLRFDAVISSGSSGGALLDAEERLIGITVAMHGDVSEFSATGLAVPLAEIPADWIDLLK